MSKEKYVANVFIVNENQLDKAVKLALTEIAKVSPESALDWSKEYIREEGEQEE